MTEQSTSQPEIKSKSEQESRAGGGRGMSTRYRMYIFFLVWGANTVSRKASAEFYSPALDSV